MREIKFRAWDKKEKNIVKDFYWHLDKTREGWINTFTGTSWMGYYPENDFILMQFTGLKDKNGVEIYESDILQNKRVWSNLKRVIFKHGAFCALNVFSDEISELNFEPHLATTDSMESHNLTFPNVEVIGNIYQNPELIITEGGKNDAS